jgi:hypothetical protein
MAINLISATLAVGALGTAATGLVDTTKVFAGGISHAGFGYIRELMDRSIPSGTGPAGTAPAGTGPADAGASPAASGLSSADMVDTLLANWMNGMETGAQKAIAKSFLKMHFNPSTAATLARLTHVDAGLLTVVANKLAAMSPLETPEADVYGRFDFALSALVDRAYERADQFYRNSCKALAAIFAVALALAGDYSLTAASDHPLTWVLPCWQAVIIGLIATPLAPVAKDIANAIQTASDAVSAVKG